MAGAPHTSQAPCCEGQSMACMQVDAIISHAEPYVHSAKKRARRMSLVANDFVRRHSVALTHSKPHDT